MSTCVSERIARLEREVAALREEIGSLRQQVADFRKQFESERFSARLVLEKDYSELE